MSSKNPRFKVVVILPAIILALLLLAPNALAQKYSVTNLGILGDSGYGGYSEAYGINASGQVVGDASTADGGFRAFLWQNGVMKDLGTISGGTSLALGINDSGQVVGWSQPPGSSFGGSTVFLAFIWQNSVMSGLGTLGGTNSEAAAINNSGVVVGNSYIPGGTINGGYRAFVWANGIMTKIVDAPWGSGASAVNNAGQVVGGYSPTITSQRAFLWQNGVTTDLGDLGGGASNANGINDLGQIVGVSTVANQDIHSFLWSKGVMTDLGALGPAYAINNVGQVVGAGAFLWQNGVATDLNKLIPTGTGLQLTDANDINDAGQIVGTAISGSTRYAVLLTPNPFANPQTVSVAHNTPTAIRLTALDTESPRPPLTFAIKAKPTHGTLGTLNISTGAVFYEPNTKFQGTDSFTFTVGNGADTSAPATVTLDVAPGVPTATAQAVSVPHNTAKSFTLKGSDPDNPALPLTFAVKTEPAHGNVNGLNSATGLITYTPAANYHGADSFTFTVSNVVNTSTAAAVTQVVAAGTPVANPQTAAVAHNTTKAIALTGADPDIPALKLTFAIASQPSHGRLGTLNIVTGGITYTPAANFQGADSFTFTVGNGINISAAARVTLNITAGTPTANAQTVAVAHNTAASITLTGTEPDVPALPLTFAIAAQPAHGALSGLNTASGAVTYTPANNFRGKDTFTFTVNNRTNTSVAATVTLNVAPGTPTANPETVAVAHNTVQTITLTGADSDNPALRLTFALAAAPLHGVLGTINAATGVVNYEPNKNYQGADSFTFTVSNGTNTSTPATVTINVSAGGR